MPECIILSGVPCSGKSTWAKKHRNTHKIISCDNIRSALFDKYRFSKKNEDLVWGCFFELIKRYSQNNNNIIIDNTNLRLSYINEIKNSLPKEYKVTIKPFHISLWKAKLRNYIRYAKTGKWIPLDLMNHFYKNYIKLYGK